MNQLYHIYTVFTSIFVRALPVQSCEEEYGIKIIYGNEVHLKHVKRLRGKRNSYSETDEDETFMRLKEDAMLICFFKAIPHKDSAADAPSIFSSECAKRAQLT